MEELLSNKGVKPRLSISNHGLLILVRTVFVTLIDFLLILLTISAFYELILGAEMEALSDAQLAAEVAGISGIEL